MNDFLIMTMTDAGRLSILNYIDSGFSLQLSHIGVGSGNYTHTTKTTEMVSKWADFPLISGIVDKESNCLIVTTMGQVNDVIKVSELGLYSNTGQLIAVVAKPNGYFFQTEPGAFFSFTISIALGQKIKGQKLTLSFASQEQVITALLALHLQHKNPHPQYKVYMAEMLKQHLATANPHTGYVFKTDVTALIKKYIAYVDLLIELFLGFFSRSLYMGRYINPGTKNVGYTVEMGSDFNHDLRSQAIGVFFTPEGNHEAWEITRAEKSIYCHTFQRSGRGRTGYAGPINWTFLTDIDGSPIAEMAVPELVSVGVGQPRRGGYLDIDIPELELARFNDLCILICPEQHHEGWQVGRNGTTNQINIHAYRRKNISRESWDYTGVINYAILRPKDGTDLSQPTVFPCLLMAGVRNLVNARFTIQRPPGKDWDLTNPVFIIQISPDASHEGWEIKRFVDRIEVYVFERVTKEGRGNAVGRCNFALFQQESDQNVYRAGTYEITIPAKQIAQVRMVGAGGSGAGSLWASEYIEEWKTMENGQDTVFTIANNVHLVASGGLGGTRGSWNNGSAYRQGIAGEGGKAKVVKLGDAVIVEQKDGGKAYLETSSDWCNRDTRGGESAWSYGGGGEGGYTVETRKHRCYGGGGGAGAYIEFSYKNDSSQPIKATLVVGDNGQPDTITPELNNGKKGDEGAAVVKFTRIA